MIKHLKNPKTETYFKFKEDILDIDFPWFHNKTSAEGYHPSFFSHSFISRPDHERKFPSVNSDHTPSPYQIVLETLRYNDIELNCIFRMNINLAYPQEGIQTTPSHVDHNFPHNNLLIYFTNAGGRTIVEDAFHDPQEDDVISFDGKPHYMELPKKDFRIALVTTYC